jgi:alanine dehydrogenase
MNIGIPKEIREEESRVALTPPGVRALVSKGHKVFIESGAGAASKFEDENYRVAGAEIVYSHEEAFRRGDIVLKVSPLTRDEYDLLCEGQTILSFLNLPTAPREGIQTLVERKITAIGYEKIRDSQGHYPVQDIMSEIAGHLSIFMGAEFLKSHKGGRGILLGGMPGVAPGIVVIIGGGVVGQSAARAAAGIGALVFVLDNDVERLKEIGWILGRRVSTVFAHDYAIEQAVLQANLLVGAVSVRSGRAPVVVPEEMVKRMKNGAVIVDVSINEGGCVETSRPTRLKDPVFVKHGVVHFCVPNIPAAVGRTATRALTNAALGYIEALVDMGVDEALFAIPDLKEGLYLKHGEIVDPHVPNPSGGS